MPGIGHLIIGAAAGRLHARRGASALTVAGSMAAYAALSSSPDLDVLAFPLGIPYSAPFGHRGAFHSFAIALLLGLGFGLLGRLLGQPWLRTTLLACAVALSHGLLDTLTDGGEGIAVLWPLAADRLFAPWRPIPVAPIMPTAWFTPGALKVVASELLIFLPWLFVALWIRRDRPVGDKWGGATR